MKDCWLCDNNIADLHLLTNEYILRNFRLCEAHEKEIGERKMSYPQKGFTYPFKGKNGDAKGKPLAECSTEDLQYYMKSADPDDTQYGEKNRKMIAECQRIIAGRGANLMNQPAPSATQSTVKSSQTGEMILAEVRAIRNEQKQLRQYLETNFGAVRREPMEDAPPSARALFGGQNAPHEEEPF